MNNISLPCVKMPLANASFDALKDPAAVGQNRPAADRLRRVPRATRFAATVPGTAEDAKYVGSPGKPSSKTLIALR